MLCLLIIWCILQPFPEGAWLLDSGTTPEVCKSLMNISYILSHLSFLIRLLDIRSFFPSGAPAAVWRERREKGTGNRNTPPWNIANDKNGLRFRIDQFCGKIGWFKGQVTGHSHISWENLAGFRLRFSHEKSTHVLWMNLFTEFSEKPSHNVPHLSAGRCSFRRQRCLGSWLSGSAYRDPAVAS